MKFSGALLTITAARMADSKSSLLVDARSEAKIQGMRGEEGDEQPGDYRGAHNAIDNHLDITPGARSDCIRGKITNSDGTVRAPITGGASCFSAGTDAVTCNAKYEVKDRSTHRVGA